MKCVVIFGVVWMALMVSERYCVPLAVLSNDISESLEEDDSSPVLDDDITTRGLARLSSAATCLVAGVEYTHGQQIYRADQCEFCLCLDGEMFCWWQDCPPDAKEGPCKNQEPFSPCTSVPAAPTFKPKYFSPEPSLQSTSTIKPTTRKSKKSKKSSIISTQSTTDISNEQHESSSIRSDEAESTSYTDDGAFENESSTEMESTSTTEEPKNCIVMGQKYRVGDNLPHSTGNCLECICGQGGKITCSPHQCVPAGDEINDYRQPNAQRGNEVFK